MILAIICGLSISSLLGFSTVATVIFTAMFSIGMFSLFIWLKLKLAFDEGEVRVIRAYIKRVRELKRKAGRFLAPIKRGAMRIRPILERI